MVNLVNRYILYLNGNAYGNGDLPYFHELITHYMCRMDEFGKDEVEFKIEKWVKNNGIYSTTND